MSIHPIPEARHFDPILREDLAGLYAARAARLRALAEDHDLSAYLMFCADITEAQKAALSDGAPALADPKEIAASGAWLPGLDRMIARLQSLAQAEVAHALQRLADLPADARIEAGVALAEERFGDVDPALAPFLWAGLSLAVAQGARAADLPPKGDEETTYCPICGCHPVASHIHTSERQGLRYLHCAMCECEWHMVRAKCSCCGDAGQLDYLSFDTPEAAIRAEACNACGGYLKVISAERDPDIETVADDLATLILDDAAASEGFGRTGFNPFALPG
ncbi:formate dehydrogenase accessory protein FdhE [Pseudogemmobacter hezensis]|uniref:formate dehydrogenase accessory protein FdhE n=1 Tax=Pseudogemmobacter hezensis TaxID=2737662 RepID=UPI001C12EDED|nr:formate dehydrogenase accessory protein FdhE [Pseudogemmobacter hezensis]